MSFRIVVDVRHIDDFGIGTYIHNLVRALGEVDTENHYSLVANRPEPAQIGNLPPNFETVVYKAPKNRLWDDVSFPLFLRSLAPDLVHIPFSQVPLFLPKPYVVTVHDLSGFLFGGRKGIQQQARLYKFKRSLSRAERVIAVSAATRRDIENMMNVPSRRIRQIYSAPDPRFFWPRDASREQQVLERYQINYPYLLYAGRIRPHKNIPRLIEAFAVVRSELEHHPLYRELRLIIIGDQITRHPEVRRAMVQTRTQQAVRFLGFVTFDTLKVLYSAASAFVFPSLYEGFGLPPLEAMATGTPVVTSSVSSLPEVAGEAAMIVNPEIVFDIARGIREVLTDDNLRRELILRGREQARSFSWSQTATEVLSLYREVIPLK